MTTVDKQIKNLIWYLLPVIIGNILPIITLPLFTRILSVEDYGIYALAIAYAVFINGISNFGLSVGYERNFFENENDQKAAKLLYTTFIFIASTYFLFATLTFIFKDALSKMIIGNESYGYTLFIAYCATGMTALKTNFLTYFKNKGNARLFVWYTIDENVTTVLFSLIMVRFLGMGILGLLLGQFFASAIVLILLLIRFLKNHPLSLDINLLKESLMLSFPLTPRIFFGVIGSQFDKYMIGLLNSLGGVGIYSLGQKIANIAFTFMTALQNVFSPQVYKKMFEDGDSGGDSIGRYLTPFFYISTTGALLLSLFAEEVLFILTPSSYHGASSIVTIFCLLYVTYFFGKQPQLIYARKTGVTSLLTLLSIALNIIINIPFIHFWGVEGAAWGSLIAGIISGIISFSVSQKYYKIKWELLKILIILSSFYLFSIISLVFLKLQYSYEIRFTLKIFFLTIFCIIGYWIKIISINNFNIIKNAFFKNKKAE